MKEIRMQLGYESMSHPVWISGTDIEYELFGGNNYDSFDGVFLITTAIMHIFTIELPSWDGV